MKAIIVVTAFFALAVLLAPAPGAAPPSAAELAFVRGEGNTSEIYLIREDGSGLRRLTSNRVPDYSPIWSPDGRRILFVSSRDGDDELYVMNADGTHLRQLTHNRRQDLTPQWSPDGKRIAFASDRGRLGEPEIWIMRADGGGARRLVPTPNHPTWQDTQFSPTWSPDGKRLIFSMTAADSNPELYSVGADGTGLRRLTRTRGSYETFGDDTMPDWSNDGGTVVFVSNREQRSSDLWAMSPDGTRQRPLGRRPRTDDWNPRISADGHRLAFTEMRIADGRRSVWTMTMNGSNARRITPGYEPDWRPTTEVETSP